MTADDTPRVWIGCLACYNAGLLVGGWFDASEAPDGMAEFDAQSPVIVDPLPREHNTENHEELWVMDHENFHGLLSGECSPMEAQRLAQLLEDSGNPAAFGAYAEYVGREYATVESFEEAFNGEWRDEQEFAMELAEDLGFTEPTEWPGSYIDWERATAELFMQDYFSVTIPDGRLFVFRNV